MRVTENMTANNAIYNLNKSQNKLNQLNVLLSSNQNINLPSDDPIGSRQILDMKSQVSSIDQYLSNISNAQTWTNMASTSLQGMSDMLTQAQSATSKILISIDDPISTTQALATLENVRQEIIDMSNVQVADQYVFGGFNSATPVVSDKKLGGVVDVGKPPNQITGIDTSGLIVGMTVSGKGIQPDTTITNIDSINNIVTLSNNPISSGSGFDYTFGLPSTTQKGNTSLSSTQFQITGINTAGLNVGDPVTGPGVPLDTTIASIDTAGQVTISKALTQATTGGSFNFVPRIFQTGDTTSGVSTITNLDTTGFHVGGAVSGPGVPAGATIASIDIPGPGGQVTLTQPLTQTVTGGNFAFTPTLIQTGNVDAITGLDKITGLDTTNLTGGGFGVGDKVTGPGVPPGTTILSVDSASQITLSNPLPAAVSGGIFSFTPTANTTVGTQPGNTFLTSAQITGLDTTNLKTGMSVSGPGVPPNTIIANVDSASQITLSQPLTQSVTGGTFTFLPTISKNVNNATTSTTNLSNQLTGLPDVTGLSIGMSVLGPNIPENTKIIGIGPGTTLTLNNNATLTSAGGTFTFGPTLAKSGITNPPNQITGLPLAQLQNLYIGMMVTGPGVPDNTTITDIDTTDNNGTGSVTLSKVPTGPGGVGQFVFEGYIDSYGSRTMMGTLTNGSSNISGLPSTANMINAPLVLKTGSTNPAVNPNQITGLADTNGLTVGMPITDNAGGTIIPPNTIVTGIDPVAKSITLSNPLTPPATKLGTAIAGANTITGLIDAANLYVGMPINDNAGGTIIPPNTTITSISAGPAPFTIGISQPATLAAPAGTKFSFATTTLKTATGVSFNFSQPISKTGVTTALTNQITGLADTTNLFVGMPVSDNAGGTIIPPNTTVTAIDPLTKTVTLSNNSLATAPAGTKFFFTPTMPKAGATDPVANPKMITGIVDTTNLFVGMPVTGPGIPANTTITGTPASVPPTVAGTVTLSNNPTVAISAGTFYFGQYSSMNVGGTAITPNPTVGAIVNNNSINLSAAATATSPAGGTQLTFSGHFATEDVKVNINKSSQVALNYSGSKLLLGGAPPATSQASGTTPSSLPVNILGTIGEVITAIQNKDVAGVIKAASNLNTAAEQVNLAQTEYASRTSRLDSAQTMLTTNQNTLKSIISSKQTLDTAKTIIQLQQQTTAYQAALQGTAKIMPISLLDYLK